MWNHMKLSSSWSTPQLLAVQIFFWQYGLQLPRTQRMLVPDNNIHRPSPPCPAVAPSSPVCCNAYHPATAEMQAMPRAASLGEERREGQIYRGKMLRGWRGGEPGFGEIKGHDKRFRKSVAVSYFNNCPFLLKDETPEGNPVDVSPDLSCTSEIHEASHPYSNCPPYKQHHYVSVKYTTKGQL